MKLIITEKPKSAQRISTALADGKPSKKNVFGVPYYELSHKKEKIIVGCAVGHLFGLKEKRKNGWVYPIFEVEWRPIFEVSKAAAFSKKYYNALKNLSKKADSFVVATDYDVEGETIGLNILRFICKQKDAYRMKFSTLTKPDLVNAYDTAATHIDWGQANAGLLRHEMDWYWGINVSRALTSSIRKAGMFKILSSGRVQGPALKIIVDREREINAFKAVPFWLVELVGEVKNGCLTAWHERDKFWEKEEAEAVIKKTRNRDGFVKETKKELFEQLPPTPFDLTTLQTEAYRCLGTSPKNTLAIAQELYTSGLISYPRTSSQKLPPTISYKNLLAQLSKQKNYAELCNKLLNKKLKPHEGKKTDPAHPAIYPTGVAPGKLDKKSLQVYDLIVRRFMATFAENAIRETATIKIDINNEVFVTKGTRTVSAGWHAFYGRYVKQKEDELPKVERGESVRNKGVVLHDEETQPPKRYTPASIIRELEKRNLGTKATRSEIIDTLFQRGYVTGKAITATKLGTKIVETLEKYCPKILDEELTRHFEIEMEEVQENKKQSGDVLTEAKNVLTKVLREFKSKERNVGSELIEATKASEEEANTVGKCPACNEGTLMMRKGKFGRFIACSRYPDCKTTFSIPNTGFVKVTDKLCESCKHPVISMIRKSKKPQLVCINPDCPLKKIKTEDEGKTCPKCGKGKLVIRKSVYGQFLACNNFPKCRNIQKEQNNKTVGKK
jgi:DNA topoisomerase-1